MGPQQLLADAFRSVNLDSSTAARLRAEAPASRFDDYLNEVAAPKDGAPAFDESEQAARPEDDAQAESERTTDDAQGETEVVVAGGGASTATIQSQALQVLASQAPVSIGTETAEQGRPVGGVDAATDLPRAGGDSPASNHAPTGQADAGGAGEDRIANQRTATPVIETPNSSSGESEQRAEVRNPSSSHQRADSTARPSGEVSQGPDSRGAGGQRVGEQRPAEVNHTDPVKPAAVDSKQSGVERVGPQVQTLHQQKVEAWLTDRREGSPEQKEPERDGQDRAGNRTVTSKLRTLSLEKGDASRRIKPGVVSGHGDGPAAAVARFLVEGTGKADVAPAVDVAASPVGRPSLPSQAAPVATEGVVGDLLTARVERTDSIEGAARLLASSGSQGRQQVTMRLDPPELGQLRLAIRMQQQDMTLRIEAQTQSVAKLIESRLGELREALATQGIRVDRADIVVRTPESGEANTNTQREPGQGPSGQSAADDRGAGFLGGDAAHTPSDEAKREAWTGAREDDGALNQAESADHEVETNDERMPATESLVDLVA